ncbi:TPA: hypothetical protein ACUMWD_001693, partial [Haemophilus influenzae]
YKLHKKVRLFFLYFDKKNRLLSNKFLVRQIVMNVSKIVVVCGVLNVLNVDYVIKNFVVD